jgi:uncharacterized protein (DUF1684 family)
MAKYALIIFTFSITVFGAVFSSSANWNRAEAKTEDGYSEEIAKWRADRLKDLNSDDGWLTLVGLLWLKPGQNSIGSDGSNDLILPQGTAPGRVGSILLENDTLKITVNPGVSVISDGKPVESMALKTDSDPKPTVLNIGTLSFYGIKRGTKYGLRVKDKESPARTHFVGLEYYPTDPNWRIAAKFEPYKPAKPIPIVNVLGMVQDMPSPGAVVFDLGGKTYRLDTIGGDDTKPLFIVFADTTTGRATYGAGRFLDTDPPKDGSVVVDFNKAYNPPCAFTTFATCPLPPKQNHLSVAVTAGEKKYAGSHD